MEKQLGFELNQQNELLETLVKKEAELKKLKKDQKTIAKNIKHIEQSRTWKYVAPIWRLTQVPSKLTPIFLSSKYKQLEIQNKQLLQENKTLQHELTAAQVKVNDDLNDAESIKLTLDKINSGQLQKSVKRAKEEGNIIDCLNSLIQSKRSYDAKYNSALKYAARLFKKEKQDVQNFIYTKVLSGFTVEDIPEFIVRAAKENEIALSQTSSFIASLGMRSRRRQFGEVLPEWVLEHKVDAYQFVDRLDIKRPWVTDNRYNYTNIPEREGMVIKPIEGAGSRGVYLVFSKDRIFDVKRSRTHNGWEALTKSMEEDLHLGWVADDEWMMEELIYGNEEAKLPPRDMKFYCFYGKVALILEVQRYPQLKYCWWTHDGKRVRTGKYEDELFKGEGFTEEELQQAVAISSEIPAPFIRIDFLTTDQGMVFGEFTPKPGNYDEFDKQTDQWLGEQFLEAEGRLIYDLLNGKKFNHYHQLLSPKRELTN
ncbi:hypothetical protein BTR23_03710 [Alkalihalophilus pseudofirmus]|nr:hypothetical protein BTR23_03710 [Alkalihalophilus pseudofirmus]